MPMSRSVLPAFHSQSTARPQARDGIHPPASDPALPLLHYGLRPTNRILLCGPPGTGKTLTARVMATAMGYKLVYAMFDSIVSPYLGETASNLRRVFEFAGSGRFVVMFDEFDIVGKRRDDPHEHGEIKRLVSNFMQMMDDFKG